METKHVGTFELKNAARGEIRAAIAKTGVIDHDGDITMRGAIPDGSTVVFSPYGHSVVKEGARPVGRGTISSTGDMVFVNGRFFLTTAEGRETYNTLKELADGGDPQEWSYGFEVVALGELTPDLRQRGARRVLKQVRPLEASPVLRAAGINTATVSIKCTGCGEVEPCGCQCSHEPAPLDLAAIRETLDRAAFAVAVSEHRDRDMWMCVDDERQALAEKALRFASQRLRLPLTLKWRHLDGAAGYFDPGESGVVNVDPDAPLERLAAIVFHEAQHAKDAADGREPYEESAEAVAGVLSRAWAAEHPDEV